MDPDVQVIKATVEACFAAIRERMDDTREVAAERYEQTKEQLDTTIREGREMNGRVIRTEEQIKTLFGLVADLARKLTGRKGANGGLTPVTLADVGRWCVIVGASVGFVFWFLTVVLQWGPKP